MPTPIYDELSWRGFIAQATHPEELAKLLSAGAVPFYIGFDPTGRSLHLGSLVPVIGMMRLQKAGHPPVALIGGATGMVGDPSGKSEERKLLTLDDVRENGASIRKQLEKFLDFSGPAAARTADNSEWFTKMTCIEWLREVGKSYTVKDMLEKESVKSRLSREQALSYTEFSYMLMQAYDFLHLFDSRGCLLQAGGDDQWGNITAGIDLIRRLRQKHAFGLTFPLLTTASGGKFGKTEKGTNVWLDPAMTSPFKFYQYLLNTDDKDVVRNLKLFTFLQQEEIARLEAALAQAPEKREAQRALARETTTLAHGADAAARAIRASEVIFSEEIRGVSEDLFLEICADATCVPLSPEPLAAGLPLVDLLVQVSLAKSKNEARRLVEGGGVYLNNRKTSGLEQKVGKDDLLFGRLLLVRKGRKDTCLVKFG
ncbi:MAG TPA: tyrosine--tRNA ligase [Elusimicrobia bacterium]|nr:tyrosine--tRNA ligase [Elusimicrobiota bacterium]